jgi:molybdopterin converting factor subunit 1
VRVKVQLYARLRELAGGAEWTCDVPTGATVADVWRAIAADHPALAPFEGSVSSARNEEFAKRTTAVADGDEVAFLPPVSGGA